MHYRAKPSGFWQRCACERSPANSPAENLHVLEFIQAIHPETYAKISHARHPSGAADLIASRIPPGRIDWVVGGRVVFFVFVVFYVFPVFVGLVAFLLCC